VGASKVVDGDGDLADFFEAYGWGGVGVGHGWASSETE
jgi:hypothetical protein